MCRFFQRLADRRLDQGFARFQVAGRLVDAQPAGAVLFHHQEAAVALDDGGHGDRGFPDFRH